MVRFYHVSMVPVLGVVGIVACLACGAQADVNLSTNGDTNSSDVAVTLCKVNGIESETEKYEMLATLACGNTPEVKSALVAYFMTLPPSPVTTNPYSDSFKAKVFKLVLPLLDQTERKAFILVTIDIEAANMREAKKLNWGNMYPVALWREIVIAIDKDNDFSVYFYKLSTFSNDLTLPDQFREDAMAKCAEYASRDKKDVENIRDILRKLEPQPESFIPWEDYNDPVKRKEYYKTSNIGARDLTRKWRQEGKEVKFEADLKRLIKFGLNAVEQIVAMLDDEKLSKERRDELAEIAAKCFSRLRDLSSMDQKRSDLLADKLQKYIDTMEDKGAFCHREYTIQGLSIYYRNLGREWNPRPESGWAPTDKHFRSSVNVTNRQHVIKSKNGPVTD